MKIGLVVPTFRDDAYALEAAKAAEAGGLDGVFVYDHIWPMGRPDRPALSAFPVLGALGASTRRITVGTLVARIGLLSDGLLVASADTLERIAPGRVILGLGTGDAKSAQENHAYGIPFDPSEQRRAALAATARRILERGIPVWVGGGAPATTALAGEMGAAVNLWNATPSLLAAQAARTEVTWGGTLPEEVGEIVVRLGEIAEAGATWAVAAWPSSLEDVIEAVRRVR
jgi:alkanesulfonate monooxygenase SsuD/methylene tetrahydromethanopterin reductase-like flavin-dependent oxidoreductase (luciferase family)